MGMWGQDSDHNNGSLPAELYDRGAGSARCERVSKKDKADLLIDVFMDVSSLNAKYLLL